ncbi:MAG: hypothetical protein K6C34_00990 [Alphaproteobacteria bacterium]|nr:hypothetical protein [Alphaproteobacteria bacterium]
MIKVLFALLLVGICFVLYLGTLELRDINKKIKDIQYDIETNENITENHLDTLHGEVNCFNARLTDFYRKLSTRIALTENNYSRLRMEQKAMNQSVFDNNQIDIEQLKKEVKEEYDEEN